MCGRKASQEGRSFLSLARVSERSCPIKHGPRLGRRAIPFRLRSEPAKAEAKCGPVVVHEAAQLSACHTARTIGPKTEKPIEGRCIREVHLDPCFTQRPEIAAHDARVAKAESHDVFEDHGRN